MKKKYISALLVSIAIVYSSIITFSYEPKIVSAQSNTALCSKLSDWSPYIDKKIADLNIELTKSRSKFDAEVKEKWEKSSNDIVLSKSKEDNVILGIYKNLDSVANTDQKKIIVKTFKQSTDFALKQRRASVDTAIKQSHIDFKSSFDNQIQAVDKIVSSYSNSLKKAVEEAKSECLKNGTNDPTIAQKIFTDKSISITQKFNDDIASIQKLEDIIKLSTDQFVVKTQEAYEIYNKILREEVTKLANLFKNEVITECSSYSVGYKIESINGVKSAVWYPSESTAQSFDYGGGFKGEISKNGKPKNGCGKFPLVVFSHGFAGCGTQSIFFTEELARRGYVVIAPDHKDAICSVDGSLPTFAKNQPSLLDPKSWSQSSYIERRDDIKNIINGAMSGYLKNIIDKEKIALAGHSLGGYTALGLAGGWDNWKDSRIKAVLLLSPYTLPFTLNDTLKKVEVPVMYQGADFDIGITPFIEGKDGAYTKTNSTKYFVKLKGGNHFIWTNLQCSGQTSVRNCINSKPEAKLINDYGIAFLEKYLKGKNSTLLSGKGTGLSSYIFKVK